MADFPQNPTKQPDPIVNTVADDFSSDGIITVFELSMSAIDIISVELDDTTIPITEYKLNTSNNSIEFTVAPAVGDLVVTYHSGYPQVSNGYAKLATPEDIEKDESGVTYPNLHRRIDDSLGLHTFIVSVFGKPILTDEFGNDIKIPDISMTKTIIESLIANEYDVQIVNVGDYVKDYVINWIPEEYQAKFIWVIRSESDTLDCVLDYTLNDIADEVYRGATKVLEGYPGDDDIIVTVQYDGLLSKDTYTLFTSTLSSFRTTEHHTHDENSNSEIP